jgi:rhodanese-related sulfurtransferase
MSENFVSSQPLIMTCDALSEKISKGESDFFLVDVRGEKEFDKCNISGSINIPLTELEENLDKFPEKDIIVICHYGIRSIQGASILIKNGIKNCYSLKGGVELWAQIIDKDMLRY